MSKVFKRVSAVAVLALGLNGLTGVAANAAAADITVGTAYASGGTGPTARTATQLAGVNNFVTYTVETAAIGTPLAIVTTGGTASCVSATGTHQIVGNGTANVIATTLTLPGAGVPAVTCTTTTPTVGTITVRVFGFTAGAQNATSTSSLTITVIDAASLALTTLTVYSVANGGCVAPLPTASTVTYMSKSAALGASELCVVAKDGNGANMATAVAVTVSTNLGFLDSDGDGGTTVAAAVGSATIAAGNPSAAFDVGGNGVSGTGVYTVSATSGGKTLTGSVSIRFFDDVTKITLTSSKSAFSLTPAAAATFASFKAEDKNGFPVALTLAAGEGSFAVSSDVGGATTGIGNDKSAMTWSALSSNTVTPLGVETAGVLQVVTGSVNEMATVSLINGGVTSNALTFYASGSAASASAITAVDATPGTQQTVSVTYRDAKGYPVADGSTVTLTASSGTLSTGAPVTANGVATATYTSPVVGGFDVDIASSLNSIAATKKIAIAGGNLQMAIDAASDAAAEAIDAANAATDAANLAAEAADAATVAAEEARDAADAATAAVEELAQQVATLMAALKAQITTLANTVAKIAKKVRA